MLCQSVCPSVSAEKKNLLLLFTKKFFLIQKNYYLNQLNMVKIKKEIKKLLI